MVIKIKQNTKYTRVKYMQNSLLSYIMLYSNFNHAEFFSFIKEKLRITIIFKNQGHLHILQQLQVGWFNFLLMMTEEVANTPKKHIYIGFRYVYCNTRSCTTRID